MNKAIDTLESLREYLENEVRPSCEYYIYSNLIDITDKAIAELEYRAKFQELEAKYNQLAHNHDLVCHENCQNLCWENEESYCKEEGCIRNYIDPSLYIDIYEDKYKLRELDK